MRNVRCGECGKTYNYDEDGFCPKCGAFNQPMREARIAADGSVVRVDGLNESNHAESFAHREFHQEERVRRRSGLDKSVQRGIRDSFASAKKAVPVSRSRQEKKPKSTLASIITVIVFAILLSNFLRVLLALFLR